MLLVRRSHTVGDEVMDGPKTGLAHQQRLKLPDGLVEVLRWHVSTLEGRQVDSELLFPSSTEVAKEIGLKKRITRRGMRRTFQDLCRAAAVKDVVARAISGPATETMQRHYSTIGDPEVQGGIAKVIDLMQIRQEKAA